MGFGVPLGLKGHRRERDRRLMNGNRIKLATWVIHILVVAGKLMELVEQ